MATGAERTLIDWLRLLRDGWLFLVIVVALGLGVGLLVTALQPTRYEATATLVATPEQGFLAPSDANTLPAVADTVARLLETRSVLEATARRYAAAAESPEAQAGRRNEATLDWLRDRLTARQVASTAIVEIAATAPTQTQAVDLGRAAAIALSTAVGAAATSLHPPPPTNPQGALLAPQGVVLRVFAAGVPEGKVSPTPTRNLLIGGDAGLLLGLVAAAGLGVARGRIRRPEELADALGVPLFGALRAGRRGVRPGDPGLAEARARLLALRSRNGGGTAVLVTGILRPQRIGEVGEALARSLASASTTALVDAELVGAALTRRCGLEASPGLAQAIAGAPAASLLVTVTASEGLAVLPAGYHEADAATILAGGRLAEGIEELKREHDYLIVCGPGLDRAAEVLSLLDAVDHALLLVPGGIDRRRLRRVQQLGDELRSRLLGALIVRTRR
jgi:succinoglycan biosynthesis transport protein ExoP